MPLKDYSLREKEIHQHMCRELGDKINNTEEIVKWKLRVPKRLRGDLVFMIEKLRTLNQRCSYTEMLRHYCPVEVRQCQVITVSGADSLVCISLLQTLLENNPSSDW
jgi:telomerase reverse transcriptase